MTFFRTIYHPVNINNKSSLVTTSYDIMSYNQYTGIQVYGAQKNSLFDFLLHHWHPLCLRVLEAVSGTSKITQHVVSPVVQKNIFHLHEGDKIRPVRTDSTQSKQRHNKWLPNNQCGHLSARGMQWVSTCVLENKLDLPWDLDEWLESCTGGDEWPPRTYHKRSVTPQLQWSLSVTAGSLS